MAARALPFGLEAQPGMRHIHGLRRDVALQAELPVLTPDQQMLVNGAVWGVARGTTRRPDWSVLIYEGATLLDVARVANLLHSGAFYFSSVQRAMRVVAVRAFDFAFVNAVPYRKLELCLFFLMA